jgi:parallel beta-helix repeat protein
MKKIIYPLFIGILVFANIVKINATEIIVSNSTELQNAINNVQSGDTISLQSSDYGNLLINGKNNNSFVTIRAYTGATPIFSSISIHNSSYWKIYGVSIKPRYSSGADGTEAVDLDGDHLTIENCIINYSDDISGWTAADWLSKTGNGIIMDGDNINVINNTITAIDHGIACSSNNSLVSHNLIANFRGDGIRGLGNDDVYEYNTIKNEFDVDDNHDDGFQSWSVGPGGVGTGTVYNVTLRGNTIINYEDPNQSYKGNLQGIGLFDGMFENWIVENNLIITDHWHGISFYGAINCKIINNTVVDNNNEPEPDPWIMVNDHKDGTPSSGVIVRNNIATDYSLTGGYTADHNIEITMNNASIYFNSPTGGTGDYHLINSSPAIDAGSGDDAPSIDKDGVARPQGSGWDLGAYEYSDATSVETSKDSPEKFALYQNYPNPFNPTTSIRFQISETGFVSLKVYNVLGNEVVTLINEEKAPGKYEIKFDGSHLSSGIYFYKLKIGRFGETKKMLFLK